jgi:hypothetical protein
VFSLISLVWYCKNFYVDMDIVDEKDQYDLDMEDRLLQVGNLSAREMLDKDGDGVLDKKQQDVDGDGEIDSVITNSQILKMMMNRFIFFQFLFMICLVSLFWFAL